jgi:hypothetical protein
MINNKLEEKLKRLLDRELMNNQTLLVEEILKIQNLHINHYRETPDLTFPSWDDIQNFQMKLDIDDLIHDNESEYEAFVLDNPDLLSDFFFDEFRKWSDLIAEDKEDMSAFLDWLDTQTKMKRADNLRRIPLDDDDKETLYDYFERNGVEIYDEGSEIFSWFLVTEWFANQLLEENETVLEWANQHWWGRRTFGQLVIMDGVMQRIAKKLYGDDEDVSDSVK